MESDPSFQIWFAKMQPDAAQLASGPSWKGEGPFPLK
jgi:hypothetical protein